MRLLYINDLRSLPNFGCRTTGPALEELLSKKHSLIVRDGLETVHNSGWDSLSPCYYKLGGIIPERIFSYAWHRRYSKVNLYRWISRIDAATGALHDYITSDPAQSVKRFNQLKHKRPELLDFEKQVIETDGMVINGEGTLIFGRPTRRDALYLLFAIAFARSLNKPVYLLNAMITECPFGGADNGILERAAKILKHCNVIACREHDSFEFTSRLVGNSAVRFVPDALFTWGEKFRQSAAMIKQLPELFLHFGLKLNIGDLPFNEPYLCVSASSSVWRRPEDARKSFVRLGNELKKTGMRVYFIATCAGDGVLLEASRESKVTFIPQSISAIAGAGILAGASVYISGRYHPAIMAAAGGVPTVFMSSNSHKTRTVQTLLGYDGTKEYSVAPSNEEISAILSDINGMLVNRNKISSEIRRNFDLRAEQARENETIACS